MRGNNLNRKIRVIDDEDEIECQPVNKTDKEDLFKPSAEEKKITPVKLVANTNGNSSNKKSIDVGSLPDKKISKPECAKSLLDRINQIKKEKEKESYSKSNKLNSKQSLTPNVDTKKKVKNHEV